MGFDISLVHGLVAELALDDDVRRREAFFDVALGVLNMGGDVALLVCTLS